MAQKLDEGREEFPLPQGCDEGYVWANGIRLHYVAAGDGPLALLLHGFPAFWYSWRDQLTVLAPRRRVVALDLRGYNLSDKPPHGYDLATLAADLRGVIEAFGARQADVIGHDWGGVLAWVMGIREPDYVRRLVVLNAPHLGRMTSELRHPGQMYRSLYALFFQLPALPENIFARNAYAVVRDTFRSADPGRAWLTDEDVERYVAAMARPGALHASLSYYRELMRRGAATLGPVRVITAPTLLLWGELDPYLGPSLADGLDEWVNDLQVRRFPTLGHWINQQEPERINDALLEFLL